MHLLTVSPAFHKLNVPEPKKRKRCQQLRQKLPKEISGEEALKLLREREEKKQTEVRAKEERKREREIKRKMKEEEKERKKKKREAKKLEKQQEKKNPGKMIPTKIQTTTKIFLIWIATAVTLKRAFWMQNMPKK